MYQLKVTGKQKVGNIEFLGIEGGFGEGKKAMLVRDIATGHGQPVSEINRRINDNRDRFKDSIDILDLKQMGLNHVFSDYGFSKAQWGNANNIYLLSERGYAKLLKILEDDTAWELYDQLVDGYFNMRQSIKVGTSDYLKQEELEIMKENAMVRKARLAYTLALTTDDDHEKKRLLKESSRMLIGDKPIEYSATDIAEQLKTSANMVGRTANAIGLKTDKAISNQNEYGYWDQVKLEGKNPLPSWIYYEPAIEKIEQELIKRGKLK